MIIVSAAGMASRSANLARCFQVLPHACLVADAGTLLDQFDLVPTRAGWGRRTRGHQLSRQLG